MKRFASGLVWAVVLGGAIAAAAGPQPDAGDWIGMPYRLSDPGTFVRGEPYPVTDGQGRIHLFWSQDTARQCCSGPDQFSLLRYAVFESGVWRGPVTLLKLFDGRIDAASACVDSDGFLHVAWFQGARGVHHMSAPLEDALEPGLWSPWVRLDISLTQTTQIRIRADASGRLHLVFGRSSGASRGFFHTRSLDGGRTWTAPASLGAPMPEGFRPGVFQFEADDAGTLHFVWHYAAPWEPQPGNVLTIGRTLGYTRSVDGGGQWSAPILLDEFDPDTDDPLTESVGSPHGIAFSNDSVHVVWTGGPFGGPVGVGRKHRISPDRGATWGDVRTDVLGLWGEQNGDGLAADSGDRVHWVGLARRQLASGPLWEGLWAARWEGGEWSEPAPVETLISPWIDTPRLAADPAGNLLAAFRSRVGADRNLHAIHTASPAFYFPHFGDGSGLSMLFAVSNFSESPALGRLSVFGPDGEPRALPFDGFGWRSEIDLAIDPNATLVLTTMGTSSPLRTGFVRVELDRPEIGGVAIFRYASGPEASVLPTRPGRRFALFVERSGGLRTGIALARATPTQPLALRLYELDGTLLQAREREMPGSQEAWFVDEVLDVPPGFRGMLVVESESLLTAVGLRFGQGILSTIPVNDLDAVPPDSTFFFPHYGDGGGLSMSFALSNFHSAATAEGELRLYAADGAPQTLPFGDGPDDRVPFTLTPNASRLVATDGSSSPLKSGFARVSLERGAAGGVAVFKYSSGPEASVLPSYVGERFALFVERSALLDTGIALAREEREEVRLTLYDVAGHVVASGSVEFEAEGYHRAAFLGEIFPDLPGEFRGMLLLESDGDFSTVGLRFGGGLLATIPVNALR